jgi:large subunit ribosomal protein L4
MSFKVAHITTTGTQSTTAWPTELSVPEVNKVLVSQALKAYLSNLRQGTSQTKTRSDLNRTKKKWFKQKGTGNARHGARTANIFVGGGVVHGPTGAQNWKQAIPQTMKKQALLHALTAQAKKIFVHDSVEKVSGKTAEAAKLLASCTQLTDRVLVITSRNTSEVIRSYSNLANVLVMAAARVSALEIASAHKIVVSPEAIQVLSDRVSG